MKKYVINEISTDGYERFAVIQKRGQDVELNVHFIEYDEFLESNEKSTKKKKGDILEGDLSIELVSSARKVEDALSFHQNI